MQISKRLKLLIVDDEVGFTTTLKLLLGRDHDVETENGSVKAYEKILENRNYDFVICDMMMPDLNGMELYEKIREAIPGFEKKFIFMSGGFWTLETASFFEDVKNLKIEKPFGVLEIQEMIQNLSTQDFVHSQP